MIITGLVYLGLLWYVVDRNYKLEKENSRLKIDNNLLKIEICCKDILNNIGEFKDEAIECIKGFKIEIDCDKFK